MTSTRGTSSFGSDKASSLRYSIFSLARNALGGHKGWPPAWRDAEPREAYDVVIIGGGGHGLATAYYLAKDHGIRNVAVLEKGWIGGGNVGPQHHHHPLQLPAARQHPVLRMVDEAVGGAGAGPQLQRDGQPARRAQPLSLGRASATPMPGAATPCACTASMPNCSIATPCARMPPFLDFDNARFPIQGGLLQRRGGTVRHDAVAWGYARAAPSDRGVDIVQNCEVTGISIESGRVTGVETTRGSIRAGKVGLAVAGNTSRRRGDGGLRLPIESHVLQAFVSEASKPLIPGVITFGAGHFYVSQSDKGGLVFGGDIDGYNSYAQRGNLPVVEDVCEGGMALMPMIGRAAAAAQLGRHDGHVHGRLADHRPHARSTASISMPAGATAASRRRRPPAGASRT